MKKIATIVVAAFLGASILVPITAVSANAAGPSNSPCVGFDYLTQPMVLTAIESKRVQEALETRLAKKDETINRLRSELRKARSN